MKSIAATSLFALALVPTALAHGYVRTVNIGGVDFHGPEPSTGSKYDKNSYVIRKIDSTNPNHIEDTGTNLACGRSAATRPAPAMATGKAGDTIKWTWDAGNGDAWPHDIGPMITYMAKCDPDCNMDASKAKWFKIDEVGKTKTPGNIWVQKQLMSKKDYSTTIPKGVPSGDYLIRHEIIALHLADKKNGCEFYPSCSQVTITGGASNGTSVGPTVSFPGAYKETDPGILINVWDKEKDAYPYPGPAIAKFDGSSSSSDDDSGDDTATTTKGGSSTKTTSSVATTSTASSSDDGGDSGYGSSDGGDDTGDDDGDDGDCTDDDSGDDTGDDGASSGTTTLNAAAADGGSKTVTVTVTVTATPSCAATPTASAASACKAKNNARSEPTTAAKVRRSRAHAHGPSYPRF